MAVGIFIVLAATGAYELAKENDGSNNIPSGSTDGWVDSRVNHTDSTGVEEVDDEGRESPSVLNMGSDPGTPTGVVVDAYPSNVPSVPGWDGNRVSPGDDVPGMVEPTPRPSTLVGEIDVVPIGEPTSVAVPAPVPADGREEIVCAYDWDCATAMRIVSCETGGTFDPYCVGAAGERGWFQIHPIHWSKPQCSGDLFDPAYNTACAYFIYAGDDETEGQGWWPWSCY